MNKRLIISIGLSVASSVGVISTAYLASKATLKSKETLVSDKPVEEKIKAVWKNYIPTAFSGGVTIACICYSNLSNYRAVNALLGNYILLNQKYKEFKNQTLETVGEEQYNEIENNIMLSHCEPPIISASTICGGDSKEWNALPSDQQVLFYDEWSQRTFVSTKANVLSAEYHLNRNHVIGGMYTPLSMWYDFLGIVINNADAGKLYWYICDSYSWIDFTHRAEKTKNGETIYKIGMPFDPMPEEYWEEYY